MNNIIITTTDQIEGHSIKQYIGLVSSRGSVATAYTNADFSKEKNLSGYRNLIQSMEEGIRKEALAKGANAVVGVKFKMDQRTGGTFLFGFGTAVIIE